MSWSKDDRDKSIWEYVRDLQTCKSCGTRPDEWLPSKGGHRHAYVPVLDRCPGCEQTQTFEADLDKSKQGKGSYIRLQPRG